ncbi:MAG: response regulator [Kofleriaceae bacterium]
MAARVFEPFFSTKQDGGGAGLGLGILPHAHHPAGGRTEVASEPGRGTTFSVTLPVIAAPRPRILVVDDEAALRRIISQLLADDYEVEVAEGGAALARLAQATPAVDVILCDLAMPEISGDDVVTWIEAHRPELSPRIVLMSGGEPSPTAVGLRARAPARWLPKPFGVDALREAVAACLAATLG